MRDVLKIAAFFPALLILPSPSSAQDACQAVRELPRATIGRLYLVEEGGNTRMLAAKNNVADREAIPTLQLAYVLPAQRDAHSGAITIKIARRIESNERQKTKLATIRLVRSAYERICGVRDVRDILFFWFPVRLAVDANVPVSEYIYYHKTTSDFRQTTLYDFHLDYKDRSGVCVGTDDRGNGNRQQFLYGDDKSQDNSLVLANLEGAFVAAAQAALPGAVGSALKTIKPSQKLGLLRDEYIKFHKLETQLYLYQPDTQCISLALPGVERAEKITVELSDLEQREPDKRHAKPQTWTFKAHK